MATNVVGALYLVPLKTHEKSLEISTIQKDYKEEAVRLGILDY